MALVRNHLQRRFCAFSKSFFQNTQSTTTHFINSHRVSSISARDSRRYCDFHASPTIDRYQGIVTDYEEVTNPPEWKFVERLLPVATVPKPPETGEFPSGWKPQNPELYDKLPYYVKRTKNHMVPVNLVISKRNERKVTKIRYIYGDIWTLAEDVEKYLKKKHQRVFAVLVNEFAGYIWIRGDFVLDTREYLLSVGL